MQEESLKETNIILGILLAILIGINSLAILFIVGVARVDAMGYAYQENMTNIQQIKIGTRSNGTITNKTTYQNCLEGSGNQYLTQPCWIGAEINSQYIAIKIVPNEMQIMSGRIYTISIYYRIATSIDSGYWNYNNNYLSEYVGACVGSETTCYQTQTFNVTNIWNSYNNPQSLLYSNLRFDATSQESIPIVETVQTSTAVIKANNTGNIYIYANINTSSNNKYFNILGVKIEDYGQDINSAISGVASRQDITNSTNSINNNITSMRDSINQQTQQSTQDQINSQKVCENYNLNNEVLDETGYLDSNGNTIGTFYYHTSEYYPVNANKQYKIEINYSAGAPSYCLYDKDKELISCTPYNQNTTMNITPTQDGYIRYSGSTYSNYTTKFKGEYCQNGNQAMMDGPGWNYTNPNSSSVDEEQSLSEQLDAFVISENDLDNLDIEMDINTSGQIWAIFTSLITGNALVYGTFLTILFLGVIKTMFAR